jgi:hypothetical protein
MNKRIAVVASVIGLGLFGGVAAAEDPVECKIVSINGKDANVVVDLKLKVAKMGESRCGLSGLVEANKLVKSDPKYCGDQNGGKVEVVWYWGTEKKHKEFKKQSTCPYDVKKGKKAR